MKKKIQFKIFAIFCFLVVINSYGQECLNQVQSSEISTFRKDESKYFYTNQYRTRTSQTIKLAPHIIRDSNGNGGLTESDLSLSIEQLNSAYQQLNIIFEACPVNYIDNDTFFSNIPYSTSEGSIEYQMAVPNRIDDAINVFFVPSAQSGAACGWSSFPSYVDLYNKDWTVMANSCVTNTSTLAHEIGHYFSLYHTHETAFGTERVTRTNTSDCNSNCSNTGDLLCDTEADPKLSNLVNSSCSYIGTSSDSCGLNHTPDPTNLMSYSRKHCRTFFSNGQINRILTSLANDRTNLVSSCTNNCLDNLTITQIVNSGQTDNQSAQYTITAANNINNGAIANYDAGNTVYLKPGFYAKSGANFRAFIEGCSQGAQKSTNTFEKIETQNSTLNKEKIPDDSSNFINIYPNPTSGLFKISSKETIVQYTILNQFNRILLNKKSSQNVIQVDIQNLPKGIYIIKLKLNNGEISIKKIIKN